MSNIYQSYVYGKIPKQVLLHRVKTYTVDKGKNDLQTENNNIFFENYDTTPQNMYKGLFHFYCIKPEGTPVSIQRVNASFSSAAKET